MKLYNSLTKQVEDFVPIKKGHVGMYACGVTVYDYPQIGNARKYVNDDLLRRALTANGFEVKHVQNVTDVGHLVSDADEGEDKLEKGAAKFGKSVWELADMFIKDYFETMDKLNILRPDIVCRATDHIADMIELIQRLIDKGLAYETPEAVYFDVSKFPKYGQMLGQQLEDKQTAVRDNVKTGDYKKNSADFVLWFKLVGRFEKHIMQWDSPWGKGFPGWHIECSAMSMKYLGESFDIHTGGEDHLPIHHPNEIAQSEGATGKTFVKYWFHTVFLKVDGQKMSKSLGNFYKLDDVVSKGFTPMALRYLYLTAHYRSPLNFTWSSLAGAQTALDKLKAFMKSETVTKLQSNKAKKVDEYKNKFMDAINNDLNFPMAIAVVWEMIKSNIPDTDKKDLLLDWDQILGLELGNIADVKIPDEIKKFAQIRDQLRHEGKFVQADEIRVQLEEKGYIVKDTAHGTDISHH